MSGCGRHRRRASGKGGVRFAFLVGCRPSGVSIGRRFRAWQREAVEEAIAGRGVVVAEYFAEGCSRRLSCWKRPAVSALMPAAGSAPRAHRERP